MSNGMVKFTPKPIVSCLHKGIILPRQILCDLCCMTCLHNCTEVKISHECRTLSTRYTWEQVGSLLRVVKHCEIDMQVFETFTCSLLLIFYLLFFSTSELFAKISLSNMDTGGPFIGRY